MSATKNNGSQMVKILAATIVSLSLLTACLPSEKKRTPGTVLDDQTIELTAYNSIFRNDNFDNRDHVKIEAHNGTILLAGETKTEENKALATKIASETNGVKNVVNELAVMEKASAGSLLDNTYITTKANSILLAKNPIEGVASSRVKVITARKIVYLMGTVTREEGDAVAEVVRNIGGVEKVVKVFDYVD